MAAMTRKKMKVEFILRFVLLPSIVLCKGYVFLRAQPYDCSQNA
jgi:hypothetical protein